MDIKVGDTVKLKEDAFRTFYSGNSYVDEVAIVKKIIYHTNKLSADVILNKPIGGYNIWATDNVEKVEK